MENQAINWAQWLLDQGVSLALLGGIIYGFFKWGVPAINRMSENFTGTIKETRDEFIKANSEARNDFRVEMQVERESHAEALRLGRDSAKENFTRMHERFDEAFRTKSNSTGK